MPANRARRGDLRFVGLDHFLSFRDVGLRGRQLDGCEDAAWSGRHGERNALFAELLVTTGLRLEEAKSLADRRITLADRIHRFPDRSRFGFRPRSPRAGDRERSGYQRGFCIVSPTTWRSSAPIRSLTSAMSISVRSSLVMTQPAARLVLSMAPAKCDLFASMCSARPNGGGSSRRRESR